MDVGRKIYYEKANGVVIWDKGEAQGVESETTFEQDKVACPALNLIPSEQLGIKQLAYGELAEQFAQAKGYRINPQTEEVEFAQ